MTKGLRRHGPSRCCPADRASRDHLVGRVSPGSSFGRPPDGPWACDAGSGQGLGRSAPERVGCLDRIAPGDLGRSVAHLAGELFKRHPVVGQERRRPVADPVAPEVGERPTPGVVATLSLIDPPPTAIFAHNDLIAIGAIDAINGSGLSCSRDISVIGWPR